nr:glycerophosphodiester phosphodiesterase family protein [Candidatus Njordarchaeum guaymaensis]
MRAFKIVGHAGGAAYEPENTIRAIRRSIEMKVDMVEVDVHATKDGQLVVIHDNEVDRTTNGKGSVKEMSLQEIRKLDAGKGEKIPTLQEVLATSRNIVGAMIEVKAPNIEKLLVDLIRRERMSDQVIVTSFMSDVIKKVKEIESKISTGQIFAWKISNVAKKALELRVGMMVPAYELVTREMVNELHRSSILVYTWTVDDRRVAEKLIELGVDGIITNKPDLMSRRD